MEVRRDFLLIASISTVALAVGCDASQAAPGFDSQPQVQAQPQIAAPYAEAPAEHTHDHPSEGPRHGALIELGDGYHAELLHDERRGIVTVFLLDSSAQNGVASDTPAVIDAWYRGRPARFTLAGMRGDASGFQSAEPALNDALDNPQSGASLAVVIQGRVYRARLPAHDHGHDHNHDHAHGHDHSHDHTH